MQPLLAKRAKFVWISVRNGRSPRSSPTRCRHHRRRHHVHHNPDHHLTARDPAATEQLLADSGVAWTSQRNGFYAHSLG
jgi:hypothetical protein